MSSMRPIRVARRAALIGLLAIPILAVAQASGAPTCTISWDGGAGTNDWATAANWTGDVLPAATDHVCIDLPTAASVVAAADVDIASLQLSDTLTIAGTSLFAISG